MEISVIAGAIVIVGTIILILCICLSSDSIISEEGYRTYKPINEMRYDICQVYADSFYDSQLNTDNRVTQHMLDWCYGWKKRSNEYPSWRSAERAFLKLKQFLPNNRYSRLFLPNSSVNYPPISGFLERGFPSKSKSSSSSTMYNSNIYNNYNNYYNNY